MPDTIPDQIAFLTEAKTALKELNELNVNYERLKYEEKKYEKTIGSEKRILEEKIVATQNQRREEMKSSYDEEISRVQEKLRKIRNKREKAKDQGIRERIEEETADLREENRKLESAVKTLFYENRVPGFCNTAIYYSIFFTRGIKDIFFLLTSIFLCFFAIPGAIFYMVPSGTPMVLILLCFASVLLFGGIYIAVNNGTKLKYSSQLKEGKIIRDRITSNKRLIKQIIQRIKKDKNDKQYNLDKYDDEINRMEEEISAINQKKSEALLHFENVTKNIIAEEMDAAGREKIDGLEERYKELRIKCAETEKEWKEKKIYITDTFESYIGRESLNEERLDRLIEILQKEEAFNITEAILVYKSKA